MTKDSNNKLTLPVVHVKDLDSHRRAYLRFYDENGITLYTRKYRQGINTINAAYDRTVYADCNGYMLGVGRHDRFDEAVKWLSELEGSFTDEIERQFNESLANPRLLANTEWAAIFGRVSEAETHNAPILKAQERISLLVDTENLRNAESKILNKLSIDDAGVVLRLFDEYGVKMSLHTQGWTTRHLHEIFYDSNNDCWNYRYVGRESGNNSFFNCLQKLVAEIVAVNAAMQNSDMPVVNDGDDTG